MTALILGLLLFFSTHSARIFAEDNRTQYIAHYGLAKWKLAYSLASAIGLGLIVWGYGAARLDPLVLWAPAPWTRHLAAVLTLPAFILIAAAYVPGTRLRAKLGHPMVIGVQLWALAHLFANGALADLLLFGCFLVWAIASFVAARRRDRAQRVVRGEGALGWDALAVAGGAGMWFVFARHLHAVLFGVVPFG
ncbi:MAG TPA: NnrU family protein [Aromatoleum sp.]|uniref:NnrU family protein n=1 Tax=Aromatoleum sp. TaxID=2307007 RepID=UPI002B46CAB7|nr:NnrU family protein [Aromatoleum sp.]HJV27689.1 NnrU family protein [Aromatoleum sp.]